jgi:WD40 repeat protein
MDGTTVLTDLITGTTLQTLPATKFVVRVAFSSDGRWLAAASYDHSISLYEASGLATAAPADEDADDYIPLDDSDDADLAMDPELRYTLRHRVATDANPEAMLFHPASSWLIYTVRGSCEMHYLGLPAREDGDGDDWGWPTRSKSFNPNPLDAHVSFAVLDMSLHPSGRMIACITGDHASSGERVLLYGVEPDEVSGTSSSGACQHG